MSNTVPKLVILKTVPSTTNDAREHFAQKGPLRDRNATAESYGAPLLRKLWCVTFMVRSHCLTPKKYRKSRSEQSLRWLNLTLRQSHLRWAESLFA